MDNRSPPLSCPLLIDPLECWGCSLPPPAEHAGGPTPILVLPGDHPSPPPSAPRQIARRTRRGSGQYQAAGGAAGAKRDDGAGVAEHAARVEAQLCGASAAPRCAGLLHLEAAGQEAQVAAQLQVQVAPKGRQVQEQGALAGPGARDGLGRAGAPAPAGPWSAGQRRQVHVFGEHPPREHHLHVGRRVADSCGEKGDASARRGPPSGPPGAGSSTGHPAPARRQRVPEPARSSIPSPQNLHASQSLHPCPAPPPERSPARPPDHLRGRGRGIGVRRTGGGAASRQPPGAQSSGPGPRPLDPGAVSGSPPEPGRAGRRRPPGCLRRAGERWPREAQAKKRQWERERYLCPGPVPKPAAAARAGREEAAGRRHTWYLGGAAPPGRSRRSRSARGGGASRSEPSSLWKK